MTTQAGFDISIGSSGAVSGASAVNNAINQVRASFIDLAAKAFIVEQALVKTWSMAKEGAQATETFNRLDRQMSQLGSSATIMVSAMQQVTQGQLNMAQSAQLASRALAVGLSPDQILTFAEAAEVLSDVMGTDIPQAFDSLVRASATGSNRALAQMGVFINLEGEMQKLAFATGRTTEQITKQERAMIAAKAIAEQTRQTLAEMSDGALSDADKLRQVEVAWEDMWHTIEFGASKATLALKEFITMAFEAFRAMTPGLFPELPGSKSLGSGRPTVPTQSLRDKEILPDLPFELRAAQLEAQRDKVNLLNRGVVDREQAAVQTAMQLQDLNVARRLQTEEQAITKKYELQQRGLAKQADLLRAELQSEKELYESTLKLKGMTTEQKIKLDLEYQRKVIELNEGLKGNEKEARNAELLMLAQVDAQRIKTAETIRQNELAVSQDMFQMGERRRQRDLEAETLYYQSRIDLALASFENDQVVAGHERSLLREQLAFKLRLTRDEVDQILQLKRQGDSQGVTSLLDRADPLLSNRAKLGIVNSGAAQDIRLSEREGGSFFSGWARGMQGYIRDTSTGFGFAQDMARRTAQTMESSFQRMFFDPMQNGWSGMLDNMLTMTKQILSQIAAQLVTSGILNILTSFGGGGGSLSSFFALQSSRNVSGVKVSSFDRGGVGDFGSGSLAILHQREAVVPLPDGRSIPVSMNAPATDTPLVVNIMNNNSGADVEARQQRNSNTGNMELEILVTRAINKSIQQGQMDKTMRARFGLTPGER